MANEIKTNTDYIRLVEHWQRTTSKREKTIVEEAIISSTKLLVYNACNRYSRYGAYSFEDLVQEASIGVLKSIEKWDSEKAGDSKYTSYMMWWVMSQIYSYLSKNSGDVKVPKKNIERLLRDVKDLGEVSRENEKYSTSYVYIDKDRGDKEDIDAVLYKEFGMYTLNDAIFRDSERDTEKLAESALESLRDKRLKEVLYRRSQGETLEDVGAAMELTGERVRQLEDRAIGILRSNKKLMKNIKDWYC